MAEGSLAIEDAVIMRMLNNIAFTKAFPFLTKYANKAKQTPGKPGCLPCQRKKKVTAEDFNAIRFAIVNMSNQDKIELKRLLNVGQVRIYYRNGANQVVKVTF